MHQVFDRKKRCEIVAVRDTEEKWQSELLSDSRYSSIRDLYQKWHKEIGKGDAASVIQKIGRALNTDGVLVVRLKERKPWGAVYGILNIALMDIPLFYRLISPDIGAWIYETATGQLVWSQEHSIFGDDPSNISNSLVSLFAELENAVPRQLIK